MKRFASHTQCDDWKVRHPDGRAPVRLKDAERAPCCYCGDWTSAGIFVRDESAALLCKGLGPNHIGDG